MDINHVFLRWQEKHGILLGCPAAEGQFIQFSDGEEVYRVAWLNPPPATAPKFPTAEAVEITEEEYLELRGQLDAGLTPEPPANEPEPPSEQTTPEADEPTPAEPVMTIDEMRREILRLREENEFLSGCLLEMSEVVYA